MMEFRLQFIGCFFFVLFAFQGSVVRAQENPAAEWVAFEKKIDQLRVKNRIPGLAVAVVFDGELIGASGFGFADNNNEVPVTADTPFWIASITKTFVGLAYLHLADQELVNLDEKATKTPNFSGLCEWLASTTIPFAKGLDCSTDITIRHILHHQVNGTPGTQFTYNPIMYSRLSRHLEHRLGEGVDKVEGRHNYLGTSIDQFILERAKMTRTMSSMWNRKKMQVYFDMADGFSVNEKGIKTKLRRPDKHIAGGAGLVSTVLDLVKYDRAIADGTVASGVLRSTFEEPATFNDGTVSPYGFGWYFQCYQGEKLMWHSGWDPEGGFSGMMLRLPERNAAFVVLANSDGVWWNNPLQKAAIENSEFASLFLQEFIFSENLNGLSSCSFESGTGDL